MNRKQLYEKYHPYHKCGIPLTLDEFNAMIDAGMTDEILSSEQFFRDGESQ